MTTVQANKENVHTDSKNRNWKRKNLHKLLVNKIISKQHHFKMDLWWKKKFNFVSLPLLKLPGKKHYKSILTTYPSLIGTCYCKEDKLKHWVNFGYSKHHKICSKIVSNIFAIFSGIYRYKDTNSSWSANSIKPGQTEHLALYWWQRQITFGSRRI